MKTSYPSLIFAFCLLGMSLAYISFHDQMIVFALLLYTTFCTFLFSFHRLHYLLVIIGFLSSLIMTTMEFPDIKYWNIYNKKTQDIIGLVFCCNWMGLLGVIKLYKDN